MCKHINKHDGIIPNLLLINTSCEFNVKTSNFEGKAELNHFLWLSLFNLASHLHITLAALDQIHKLSKLVANKKNDSFGPFLGGVLLQNLPGDGCSQCWCEVRVLCEGCSHLLYQETVQLRRLQLSSLRMLLVVVNGFSRFCQISSNCGGRCCWWIGWAWTGDWIQDHSSARSRCFLHLTCAWVVVLTFVSSNQQRWIFYTSLHLQCIKKHKKKLTL